MNVQEKKSELIKLFTDKFHDQTIAKDEVAESQKELLEQELEKTIFSLRLLQDGNTLFRGEKIDLTDSKIEMMYRNYIENPI